MTAKPQPKRELAISHTVGNTMIFFYGSPDAIEEVKQYGHVEQSSLPGRYFLVVNAMYDFDEVLEYMKNYN